MDSGVTVASHFEDGGVIGRMSALHFITFFRNCKADSSHFSLSDELDTSPSSFIKRIHCNGKNS
jgi:hypothetical protein